jgi:serine/threonine protein kinase
MKLKNEIAVLKMIRHPYVLKLYDVLETSTHLYLVTEHMKGGELFDHIISNGRLCRTEALRIMAQICMGLEHCHAHGICHRLGENSDTREASPFLRMLLNSLPLFS